MKGMKSIESVNTICEDADRLVSIEAFLTENVSTTSTAKSAKDNRNVEDRSQSLPATGPIVDSSSSDDEESFEKRRVMRRQIANEANEEIRLHAARTYEETKEKRAQELQAGATAKIKLANGKKREIPFNDFLIDDTAEKKEHNDVDVHFETEPLQADPTSEIRPANEIKSDDTTKASVNSYQIEETMDKNRFDVDSDKEKAALCSSVDSCLIHYATKHESSLQSKVSPPHQIISKTCLAQNVPFGDCDRKFLIEGKPSKAMLILEVFSREETGKGWREGIKEELREACDRFGTVMEMRVVDHDNGEGSIFVSFGTKQMAEACANSLAGRRFYNQKMRISFVQDAAIASSMGNDGPGNDHLIQNRLVCAWAYYIINLSYPSFVFSV